MNSALSHDDEFKFIFLRSLLYWHVIVFKKKRIRVVILICFEPVILTSSSNHCYQIQYLA